MIIHKIVAKKGIAILTPESSEDIWTIRRIVTVGDFVSGDTSRVVKESGDFIRPDKGERIRISVTIKVEKIVLDSVLDRLRITGEIDSSSNEIVSTGSSHSLIISPTKRIGIRKERLSNLDIQLIKKSQNEDAGFIIVALDRRDAGLGMVKGIHLQIFPSISSGFSGKFYREVQKPIDPYFKKIEEMIKNIINMNMEVYLSGPGTTKNEFFNFLSNRDSSIADSSRIVDGIDSTGEDGVYLALHSENLQKNIESTRLGKAVALLEEAVKRISLDDKRVAIGFDESRRASLAGATDSILVTNKIFETGLDEEELINLLNKVESLGGRAYLIDTSTDLGVQVSKLGGVIALLRYPVYSV